MPTRRGISCILECYLCTHRQDVTRFQSTPDLNPTKPKRQRIRQEQGEIDRRLFQRPDDRSLGAQLLQPLQQIPVEPLDQTATHVERLHDPDRGEDLLDERGRLAFEVVSGPANDVVCPAEEGEDDDDERNDGEEDAGEFGRIGETRDDGLRDRLSIGLGEEGGRLTAMTVERDQMRYPSFSPNAVRIAVMSLLARVLISPGPTFSKNAASCTITEAT